MHYEVLVEDRSGKACLDIVIPRIIGTDHSFRVIAYKGIGKIPRGLQGSSDPHKRMLLDQLPRLLKGYGEAYAGCSESDRPIVIVVCDLDNRTLTRFRSELNGVLRACRPRPNGYFCIAIEEGEAWLLGDIPAVKAAYPRAKNSILASYRSDSICGTWECLADAVYPGGSAKLIEGGWIEVGTEKSRWAERIGKQMNVENNCSPSFCEFRDQLRKLSTAQ